jgi:tRNA (guanine37-N1)-methyltransferase
MRIDVITLFPELFETPLRTSLLGRAVEEGTLEIGIHDLREHGLGKHRSVDDTPYGGGAGMVMLPEPIFAAVEALGAADARVILMSPRGTRLNQPTVQRLAGEDRIVVICGRYEGVDERVVEHLVDEEVSIGDYVLSGGELPALVLIEAISRHVPGVLGNPQSLDMESHAAGLLEHPQYTKPSDFRGHGVPEVLLSGDHGAVEKWRREKSEQLTKERRPDLLE